MITAKRDNYKVTIDEEKGCIKSFVQKEKEYIYREIPMFNIGLRDKSGEIKDVDTFDMKYVKTTAVSENTYELVYETKDGSFSINVNIIFTEEIKWNVAVKNNSEYVIESVDIALLVSRDLIADGGKSKVLWGFNEGVLVDNLEQREKTYGFRKPEYPGEGLMPLFPAIVETQFMAYYDGEHGLYMATHDNEGYMKAIDFFACEGGMKLWFKMYTDSDFGCDYKMSYDFVMRTFSGDWQDAAEIYKNWFEENKSTRFIPIEENPSVPDWYEESPLVITYPVRGIHDTDIMNPNKMFPYINGMKAVEKLAEKLDSKIMVILMHWEGTAPWAPPYVWPPYGGEVALKGFIDELHRQGHLLGLYCSGLGWTQYSRIDEYNREEEFEKENLLKYMCAAPWGEVLPSKVVTGIRHGYDMCPETEFTKKVMTKEAKKMMDAGVDYIQLLDQNHGGTSYFCYGRDHGHPPVPGKWQTDAVNELLERVHKQKDKILLGCESAAAESYIPNLLFSDNRFNLTYTIGVPVPVYAYVYHKYVNNFMGNQVYVNHLFDYNKNPENLLMRIAYSFCAGDMLTLVLDENGNINWNWGKQDVEFLPNQEQVISFVKCLNGLRVTEKKYLHLGQMEKPYRVDCETYGVEQKYGFILTFPRVFTSKWRAKDGTWAQYIVNYHETDVKVNIVLDKKCILKINGEVKEFEGGELVIPAESAVTLTN